NSNPFGGNDLTPGTGSFTMSNSLIGAGIGTSPTSTGPTPDANGNLIGSFLSPIDPLLAPLAYNGGPTQTHALLVNSPARNRGANPLGLAADQRGPGFSRQLGAAVDMGAYEAAELLTQIPPVTTLPRPILTVPISVLLTTRKIGRLRRLSVKVKLS